MKICWENLEKLKYNSDCGEWQHKTNYYFYIYKESCKNCGESFLARKSKSREGFFCSIRCGKSKENHPMSGKNHSEETKQLQSILAKERYKNKENHPNYCRIFSQEHKRKIGENHADFSGENHPNWKGGVSCEPYCDVWLDKGFKESIMERDGYQCLNPCCSRENKELCIHHINYIKKDCSPFNLITVCKSCNSKANFDRKWHEAWYSIIISNRYEVYCNG